MRVHYIDYNEQNQIAYFPDSKRFFKINETAKELIGAITTEQPDQEIQHKFEITPEQLENYRGRMTLKKSSSIDGSDTPCNTNATPKKVLNRLVIHLSNDCNLRCKYCYANGGSYDSDAGNLKQEMLDTILERFYNQFDCINTVQFFGGEPLMNIPMLEYACEKIREIDGNRDYQTVFGIVINGTLINKKFIELTKKFDINVTVSYDGDPLVNDIMRVYANEKGSSDVIIEKTKWLKQETGQPSTIEVTYNQHHVDHNIGILDVVRHVQELFPNTYVHLVPAGGTKDCDYAVKDLSIFADSITEICELFGEPNCDFASIPTYSLAERILRALNYKDQESSPYICDAGFGTISVSITGDVYPCFMFTDQTELKLGNVQDPQLFYSDSLKKITQDFFRFSNKNTNEECKTCFIDTLCNGCLGLNSYHSGDPLKLSGEVCQMFRDMTQACVIGYTKQIDRINEESKKEPINASVHKGE